MSNEAIDIKEIMKEIREDISKKEIKTKKLKLKKIEKKSSAGSLHSSNDFYFLSTNHRAAFWDYIDSIKPGRFGILGKLLAKTKQKSLKYVKSLIPDYFENQRSFKTHLVRHLSSVNDYIDNRDFDNFWELKNKIDSDFGSLTDKVNMLSDDVNSELHTIEKNITNRFENSFKEIGDNLYDLNAFVSKMESKMDTLSSVVSGVESIIALSKKDNPSFTQNKNELEMFKPDNLDYSYLLLENRFRGDESEIKARQQIYIDHFLESTKPIFEIGPGRGELLESFKTNNITSFGMDLDMAMVKSCKEKGLSVEYGDAIAHLQTLEDNSLGGLIALQVVEHLTQDQLATLFKLASKKVIKSGKIIFETINPQSILALSSNYFRDPTHVFPQHPDTLSFLAKTCGLDVLEIKNLSPVPSDSLLRELEQEDYLPARWIDMVSMYNHNIKRLNDLLFGFQDYCLIAQTLEV